MRFTDGHNQLRKTVRDFVEKEINPHIDEDRERNARGERLPHRMLRVLMCA